MIKRTLQTLARLCCNPTVISGALHDLFYDVPKDAVTIPGNDLRLPLGRMMKSGLALTLCILVPMAVFGSDGGYKVDYDGGSIPDLKPGTGLKLYLQPAQIRLTRDKTEILVIPSASVTEISYGQDVHRRVGAAIGLALVSFGIGALMALTKSKKHYIGLTWDDDGKKGGGAFQVDKNEYRGVLAGLEGVTGKKAVNSDSFTVKN